VRHGHRLEEEGPDRREARPAGLDVERLVREARLRQQRVEAIAQAGRGDDAEARGGVNSCQVVAQRDEIASGPEGGW
jgi:hypothetical protein